MDDELASAMLESDAAAREAGSYPGSYQYLEGAFRLETEIRDKQMTDGRNIQMSPHDLEHEPCCNAGDVVGVWLSADGTPHRFYSGLKYARTAATRDYMATAHPFDSVVPMTSAQRWPRELVWTRDKHDPNVWALFDGRLDTKVRVVSEPLYHAPQPKYVVGLANQLLAAAPLMAQAFEVMDVTNDLYIRNVRYHLTIEFSDAGFTVMCPSITFNTYKVYGIFIDTFQPHGWGFQQSSTPEGWIKHTQFTHPSLCDNPLQEGE